MPPAPFSLSDAIMAVCAFRYCLGRQSYVVSTCIEWLREHWSSLPRTQQRVILRDIVEALMDGQVGGDMDDRAWRDFFKWGLDRDPEALWWVQESTAYKRKPWPVEDCAPADRDT